MADTMTDMEPWLPLPNERHPSLPDLDLSQFTGHAFHIAKVPFLTGSWFTEDKGPPTAAAFPRLTLTRRKVWGPAPYVGRPFVYVWDAWVTDDGTNRAICSDARIRYVEP